MNSTKVFALVAVGHLTPEEGAHLLMSERYRVAYERSYFLNGILTVSILAFLFWWTVTR